MRIKVHNDGSPERVCSQRFRPALWVAYFRARETHRPEALFRDPFAFRLLTLIYFTPEELTNAAFNRQAA
jgi:O-methyltransferase involved in polyketide biosynthesis